jgi:hypothetical protein
MHVNVIEQRPSLTLILTLTLTLTLTLSKSRAVTTSTSVFSVASDPKTKVSLTLPYSHFAQVQAVVFITSEVCV